MKAVVCLCALVVVTIARPEDKYSTKYDNVDVNEILNNKRLLDSYAKCGLDQGKCTKQGEDLKSKIQEALETYCAKCTEKQKENIRLVIGHLINHEPEYWRQLCAKYDPDGKYVTKYEEELKTIA